MVEGKPQDHSPGTPAVDPLLGRTLNGRFRILEPIGAGGMGKVYRAVQMPLERVVALKVLNPSFPVERDPAFKRRFMLEASMTSKLRHPNTVTVIDYGQTDDGVYFIAMELLEGRTLGQVLAQEKVLPWIRAFDIAQQIGRSLREAHNLGVVHRDLKPANVMLLEDGGHDQVKVLDFGLVKSFLTDPAQADPEVTQAGMFLGSPQYMAPEQARNNADPRSDIYSLGILMYQMVTGRPPFSGRDYLDIILQHLKDAPKPPSRVRPDLGIAPEIELVILKCLEKEPSARYASMDELVEAIRNAGSAAGLGPSGPFLSRSGIHRALQATPPPMQRSPAPDSSDAVNTTAIAQEELLRQQGPLFANAGRPRRRVSSVGFVMALALGFVGVWFALPRSAPPPALPTPLPAPTAAASPVAPAAPLAKPVVFHVSSDPEGARVFVGRQELGTTPTQFELPAGPDGTATAEMVFVREGYPPQSATAGGSGDVVLREKLQKRVVLRIPSPMEPGAPAAPNRLSPGVAAAAPVTTAPAPAGPVASAAPVATPARLAVPEAAPAVLPYADDMPRPVRLSDGEPIRYTREALEAQAAGTMLVRCVITTGGEVDRCRVLKSVPFMEQPVLRSLTSQRYRPVIYGGHPVNVEYLFTVRLVLPH